jgi:hypothetical protein
VRSISLVPNAATILPLSLWISNYCCAGGAQQQVCGVGADYSNGIEDYSEAIRRHVEDERALASQSAMSVADSFPLAGEIRGSE